MSKLQYLINELCPNGVEYRTLGEIATDIYRGNGIKRDEITEDGIPCVRYGEIYTTYGIWFDKCVSHTHIENMKSPKYFEYGDILFAITGEKVEDIAKSCAYMGNEKCLAGGDIVILKHSQNPKYLSYALSTTEAQAQKSKGKVKSKVVHASVPSIREIVIPIPPLEIQQEIVNILDRFTEVKTNLVNGLTQELEHKRKIFEYSKKELLIFDDVDYKYLGDITEICTGNKPLQIFEDKALYEYINAGTTNSGYTNEFNCGEAVTTPSRGQGGIGFVGYQRSKFWLGALCYKIQPLKNSPVITKFIYHYLSANNYLILNLKNEGGTPAVNSSDLKKIKFPVPSLAEQERIVVTLDKLTETYNAVTDGIQKEIEQIEKVYTYCTDKLLTFKAVSE